MEIVVVLKAWSRPDIRHAVGEATMTGESERDSR